MATLRVLSVDGDRAVSWDTKEVQTGDTEGLAAVKEAERIFEEERRRGKTAFRLSPGRPATRIDRFDPDADQIIMVPRVQGG